MPLRKPDIGILFVHGIGEQAPGETLRSYADPIVYWLREWMSAAAGGEVDTDELAKITHTHGSRNAGVPAHLELTVSWPGNDKEPAKKQNWLLAECHWADAFPTPSTYEVAKWTLPVLPAALVAHFARRITLAKEDKEGVFRSYIATFVFLVPLLVASVVTMLALLALSLIPIDRLKAAVSVLQEKLTLVVGDSYVFIQSASRRGAILHRFRHDLDWLGGNCKRVVVVAHSQGAAVAFHGMRDRTPHNLDLFVTIGGSQQTLGAAQVPGNTVWVCRTHLARSGPPNPRGDFGRDTVC